MAEPTPLESVLRDRMADCRRRGIGRIQGGVLTEIPTPLAILDHVLAELERLRAENERLLRAAERPPGWKWYHEHEAELLERDGLMCEQHPGLEFPHGDCAGPGMTWKVEGRTAVERLRKEAGGT